jgi:two-component system, NarL family, sensor histidine kinase BarA
MTEHEGWLGDVSSPGNRSLPVLHEEDVAPERPPKQGSILDRKIELGDLVDLKTFRELCASFVDLYKIGIKIFDSEGTKLVDIRVGNGDWCGYIFSNPDGRVRCTNLVGKIKSHRYESLEGGQIVTQDCFSGLRYVIMPIMHGGDLLGRVVYGPFIPEELARPGDTMYQMESFDPERLWGYGDKIRRASDKTISKIVANFRQVLDTVLAIAFRALMTQHLHLESITTSYNELAETNRALRQSVEKLKELDRMKASFLAMLSHELRTPLTSIIGYSEMLLEGMAGEIKGDQKEFIGTIREKGESLMSLLTSLLEISKIEAGALSLMISQFELHEIVSSAHRMVVPQAQKKGIAVEIDVPQTLPRMTADRDKVNQMVVNLLTNAVKFTPKGGRIIIRASEFTGERRYSGDGGRFGSIPEQFIRIDISDSGIGIPADKLQLVFKAFYQVDNSFTREYGGTGLGLAIVKSFVDAHGGEVWVESVEGRGTKFSLLIPPKPTRSGEIAIPART